MSGFVLRFFWLLRCTKRWGLRVMMENVWSGKDERGMLESFLS
jgi:hypothetical protein